MILINIQIYDYFKHLLVDIDLYANSGAAVLWHMFDLYNGV